MKKWIFSAFAIVFLCTASTLVIGDVKAQEITPGTAVFGSVRSNFNDDFRLQGIIISGGLGFRLLSVLGGDVWNIDYADLGSKGYGSLNTEIALLWGVSDRLVTGLIAGPNTDWIGEPGEGVSFTAYLTGASGLYVGYVLNEENHLGLSAIAKYKFGADAYPDGYIAGLAFYKLF